MQSGSSNSERFHGTLGVEVDEDAAEVGLAEVRLELEEEPILVVSKVEIPADGVDSAEVPVDVVGAVEVVEVAESELRDGMEIDGVAEVKPVDSVAVEDVAAFELAGLDELKPELMEVEDTAEAEPVMVEFKPVGAVLMDKVELPEARVTVEKPDHPLGR